MLGAHVYPREVWPTLTRRRAMRTLACAAAGVVGGVQGPAPVAAGTARQRALVRPDGHLLQTVTGPVPGASLGLTLSHEHVFSRFGEPPSEEPSYPDHLADTVAPYLQYLHALGVRTIVDGTAAWFGRAPQLLREISTRSGVLIVTNTGLYGAADDRYVPAAARVASADDLAAAWTREFVEGIAGSGVRPGFMKIAVDAGSLSPTDRRLVVAAARTHLRTGMTIACHTGNNAAAAGEQLEVLRGEGVAASAWVWVHAHVCEDEDAIWAAAERGAWLGLDGISAQTYERHLALLHEARRRRLLHRVLLSHDGNAFPAPGRLPRPFDLLLTSLRYRLVEEGFTAADLHGLLVANPSSAWAGGRRPLA